MDYMVILSHGYIADCVVRFRNTIGEGVNIGVAKRQFSGFDVDKLIKVEIAGNILDLRQSSYTAKSNIKWLDADSYIDLNSGEIKQALNNSSTRGDKMSIPQLRKSFREMRGLINSNFFGEKNESLITLTYKENMTDVDRLYYDLKKFTQALKRRIGTIKYVTAVEPQERGAWHAHILCKQLELTELVTTSTILECWEHGIIVDVQPLEEVDNVGAYLTAYLSNTPEDAQANGAEVGKAVKKGNRLHMYPRGTHVYRASRNCEKPVKIKIAPISAEMDAISTIANCKYSASIDVIGTDVNTCKNYLLNRLNHCQYQVNPQEKNSLIKNLDADRELMQALERMHLV